MQTGREICVTPRSSFCTFNSHSKKFVEGLLHLNAVLIITMAVSTS